jgi:hypothetical protein
MATDERTVYRYGDFPELFWDLKLEAEVDRTNPSIIARLLEHAAPATIWKLVPAEVLLRDFEKLDLPEHTRRFWSIVVGMMREARGLKRPAVSREERGITYRTRPRFHPDSDQRRAIPQRGTYRYGDLPELFWDRPLNVVVDGSDPEVIARLLEDAPPELVWKLVDADVLLRDFEALRLPDHTRRFWSLIIDGMREKRGIHTGRQSAA